MNSPFGTEETPEPVGHSECSGRALDHTRCSEKAQMTIKATAAGAYGHPLFVQNLFPPLAAYQEGRLAAQKGPQRRIVGCNLGNVYTHTRQDKARFMSQH